jgi:hypothetical protein
VLVRVGVAGCRAHECTNADEYNVE